MSFKGALLIDCVGVPDRNPMRPLMALKGVAAESGLHIVAFSDVSGAAREDLRKHKIPVEKWPGLVRVPFQVRAGHMCSEVSRNLKVQADRCIYVTDRPPSGEVSVLQSVHKTGAHVLSIASYDARNRHMPSCTVFYGADGGEFPHSDARPASQIIALITKKWEMNSEDRAARNFLGWLSAHPERAQSRPTLSPQAQTL